jgi:hypothetical protein
VHRNFKTLLFIWLAILLAFSPIIDAAAQTGWDIRTSLISTLETPDAMVLKVYFNVFDPKTSLPVLDTGVTSATISLPQTNFTTSAEFKKPDVPIYIVLVLDASGSMGGAAEALKKAAKASLNNTPDNAFFSVVQFNEEIKLLQDFTQNIPAVSFAIDQYKVANKGTCMYDATYSAAEALQKAPPGRRAVILFTDGKDEDASGKPCSKHTYLEVSDFAQQTQIPINTIGISFKDGALNEVELKGLAASTGGFSAVEKQGGMEQAFQNIMDGLRAQYMVETLVYPKRGKNEVVLTLNIGENKETLSKAFTIESNTEYPGPPSPVKGQMSGLQFKPEDQTYDVQLGIISPELVQYVKIAIWDKKAGSKVAEYQFDSPQQFNNFNIPTDKLVVGRDYELRMIAVSNTDQTRFAWATDTDGKKFQELVHEFTFDPTADLPALEIQSVTQQENDLILTVKTTNSGLIGGFDGWLVDDTTNTQVAGSNFNSPALGSDTGTIQVPLSKFNVPDGKYTLVVRTLGKNNQVYSTTQYEDLTYDAKLPNYFKLITAALVATPIILVGIVAIIAAVVGFMMYTSMREKSLTGTPVLQGRMGEKLGSGKKTSGPVIPVADNEPVLSRGRNAAPPAVPGPRPPDSAPAPVSQPPRPVSPPSAEATIINNDAAAGATLIASAPVGPQATLTVTQATGAAAPRGAIPVAQFPFVIGRSEGQLIIQDGNISRKHAQISFDAARQAFTITDLNSSNGTRLNNQRIPPGQPTPLAKGTLIGLGPNVTLRFDIS